MIMNVRRTKLMKGSQKLRNLQLIWNWHTILYFSQSHKHRDNYYLKQACRNKLDNVNVGHMFNLLCSLGNMYCKSTNFSVPLYLANLANYVFSLIFVAPTYVNFVDRTLCRRGDAKFNSLQITLF